LKINAAKVDNDLLIINPGQEVTVDRYIGSNNKLTFSAYEIDTTNMSESRVKEVHKAIEKNGVLEIVFWNEKKIIPISGGGLQHFTNVTTNIPYYTPIYSGSTITLDNNGNVILTGNVKINGTLDINNGSFTVMPTGTFHSSGTSGFSGKSGTSGFSGVNGASGVRGSKFIIDPDKAMKKWAPVLDSLGVTDADKRKWMAEYAEMHQMNDSMSYSTLNQNGMGNVLAPVISTIPGSTWQGAGQVGSGDISASGMNLAINLKNIANTADYSQYVAENITTSINYNSFIDGTWNTGTLQEPQKLSKKIETGRIEKGGKSDQYFSHTPFEVGVEFYKIKFKLLPFSMKPVKKNSMTQPQ
jgi:hypothetical protein